MRVCVTGGSGFIGTRLVSKLVALQHEVSIFDIAPSTAFPERTVTGDVRDAAALGRAVAGCECVIHLAAEHRDDVSPRSLYFDVNVGGSENVAAAMAEHGVPRAIFISSVSVYGLRQRTPDESSQLDPDSPYGESKVAAEAVFMQWQAAPQLPRSLVVVRPVVVFGEGNRGNVFNLIEQIRRGRFVMVGRGNNLKSVAYVQNLVDFICTQLDAGIGSSTINYADKPDRSVRQLVDEIHAALGRSPPAPIFLPVLVGLAGGYLFDFVGWLLAKQQSVSSERIRKFCADTSVSTVKLDRTGFRPSVERETALRLTIAALDVSLKREN